MKAENLRRLLDPISFSWISQASEDGLSPYFLPLRGSRMKVIFIGVAVVNLIFLTVSWKVKTNAKII
jgi:hypothetical protein